MCAAEGRVNAVAGHERVDRLELRHYLTSSPVSPIFSCASRSAVSSGDSPASPACRPEGRAARRAGHTRHGLGHQPNFAGSVAEHRHEEHMVREYAQHFNTHRPHRSLYQRTPLAKPPIDEPAPGAELPQLDLLRRRDRLGGLLREYRIAA
jgi:hypothetical protein